MMADPVANKAAIESIWMRMVDTMATIEEVVLPKAVAA